jgi:hypothetical protein
MEFPRRGPAGKDNRDGYIYQPKRQELLKLLFDTHDFTASAYCHQNLARNHEVPDKYLLLRSPSLMVGCPACCASALHPNIYKLTVRMRLPFMLHEHSAVDDNGVLQQAAKDWATLACPRSVRRPARRSVAN